MPSGIDLQKVKSLTTDVDLYVARTGPPLEVSEYGDKGLVCLLPRVKVTPGQLVSLDGKMRIGHETLNFSATGKVVRSSEVTETLTRLEIDLHQYEKGQWKKFLGQLTAEQERVTLLFEKIKGGE